MRSTTNNSYQETRLMRKFLSTVPPRGECVYLMLTDKGVQRCGAKCKGQRCDDHPQGVRVHLNIGGKGGAAL